jgi:hypothetical protein
MITQLNQYKSKCSAFSKRRKSSFCIFLTVEIGQHQLWGRKCNIAMRRYCKPGEMKSHNFNHVELFLNWGKTTSRGLGALLWDFSSHNNRTAPPYNLIWKFDDSKITENFIIFPLGRRKKMVLPTNRKQSDSFVQKKKWLSLRNETKRILPRV